MSYCAVYGCKCTTKCKKKDRFMSFFSFPFGDASLMSKWIVFCKRQDFKPTKNNKICSIHFAEDAFVYQQSVLQTTKFSYRRRLKNEAVPTLFGYQTDPPKAARQTSEIRQQRREKKEVIYLLQIYDSLIPKRTKYVNVCKLQCRSWAIIKYNTKLGLELFFHQTRNSCSTLCRTRY